jgi:hypothetical protein
MNVNRNYKDSLFIDLFSKPETLRELYNAIADTNYGEETLIEVNTLENVLVKGKTNDDLLQKSETLQGYSLFINRVRYNLSIGFLQSDALKEAISWCISQGILAAYLTQYRSEVENMLLTEFNIDVALEVKEEETDAKWQQVVAEKDAEIAQLRAKLEALQPS